jgi:hypothetical protein
MLGPVVFGFGHPAESNSEAKKAKQASQRNLVSICRPPSIAAESITSPLMLDDRLDQGSLGYKWKEEGAR